MKKITLMICLLLVAAGASAQQEKGIIGYSNWLDNWTEFKPQKAESKDANQILAGNITENTKLLKRNVYILQGNVYVTNNAVLTIEPGTVIIGDAVSKGTLVITKGAQIIAAGLETDPIVFTSNQSMKKAGDWGGVVILGDAPINKFGNAGSYNMDLDAALTVYGGNNPASNSGVLKYVRIEFAGKKVKGMDSFNGLTIAGVGNKTILENIMVSYSGGDSFAFYGGDVNPAQLVSYKSINDDFKFTQGIQCRLFNSLAVRSSYLSSNKDGSRCLEVRTYEKKNETDFTKKSTFVSASNMTMLNDSENITADIQAGLVKEAVYVGENASLELKRSVVSGFNPAVLIDSKTEINEVTLKKIKFEEMFFNQCSGNIFTENKTDNTDLENWYGNSIFFNVYSHTDNKETFVDLYNAKRPDYRLQLGKITASSGK
ncbi:MULTISPECIES: hypothetical protein [unclassified Flavobacterium]|jgi:uncharacterized membrane protein|uniref:hypothetical protein n=1 Tax=unclassified Flavobacterium TaxID=196869 RepID=UPI0012A8A221|nr:MULTISPECIES: hypothetical protein [unclassified Flavobacterium]MBF4486330.1 hypothetical protein [Flavobacterium sp. CSZ]QGK73496.1 hypothetical protein GIY83_05295 [Flavobacterium sp. SLB02]